MNLPDSNTRHAYTDSQTVICKDDTYTVNLEFFTTLLFSLIIDFQVIPRSILHEFGPINMKVLERISMNLIGF